MPKFIFFILILLSQAATSQVSNCNIIDTVGNAILKTFSNNGGAVNRISKHIQDTSEIFILGKETVSNNADDNLIIGSLNASTGQPLWLKRWVQNKKTKGTQDFTLSNGYLYITDVVIDSVPHLAISKWDKIGNHIWSKSFAFPSQYTNYAINYIPSLSTEGNELNIAFQIQCNGGANCSSANGNLLYEGIGTVSLDLDGHLLWSNVFGVKQNSDNAFYNNKPIGLKKIDGSTDTYILFSETSGWPYEVPGNPPVNNYKWLVATRFNQGGAPGQYSAKYFTPQTVTTNTGFSGTCYAASLDVRKLQNGTFSLYTHNLNAVQDRPDDGFFFFTVDGQMSPISGCIMSSHRYECGNVPFVTPTGKIITGNSMPLSDSFTIVTIENNNLVSEKKYPKIQNPIGQFTTTYRYITELTPAGKQVVLLNNQKQNEVPYAELHIENELLNKPQCGYRSVQETSVVPVGIYSYAITWDTVFSVQLVELVQSVLNAPTMLDYQRTCSTISRCDSAQLNGPDSVCAGQIFQVVIRKNSNCYKQLTLSLPAGVQLIQKENDSVYTIRATQGGQFVVALTFPGCSQPIVSHVLFVRNSSSQSINLTWHDSTICAGVSITAVAPPGFINYRWDASSNFSQSLTTSVGGWHYIEAESVCGAINKDSFLLRVDATTLTGTPQSKSICRGDTAIFQINSNTPLHNISWQPTSVGSLNNRADTFSAWAMRTTNYRLTGYSPSNCDVTATLVLNVLSGPDSNHILPQKSYTSCTEEVLSISPTTTFLKYRWSNGDTTTSTTIKQAGSYKLIVQDADGCHSTANFTVQMISCIEKIWFPSAFTPNQDGRNDVFGPIIQGRLPHNFEFRVLNRWGQLIFSTNGPSKWDGKYHGVNQPSGSYVWFCNYQYAGGVMNNLYGSVLLIR